MRFWFNFRAVKIFVWARLALVFLIDFYKKYFSPFIFYNCKFYPTCSQYARQAILKFGIIKGVFLSLKRLFKCAPYSRGGYDPVP